MRYYGWPDLRHCIGPIRFCGMAAAMCNNTLMRNMVSVRTKLPGVFYYAIPSADLASTIERKFHNPINEV